MSKTEIPQRLRRKVAEQAKHRCGYCLTQERIIGTEMEVDHIIPEALEGKTEEANLWLACERCNKYKGERIQAPDPETNESVLLFHPRQQRWADHFAWSPEGDHIIGLTPTGRATIMALKLNREKLVQARKLWVNAGWHPPQD
ncbi:MAG TPA: HNH endonuclease signature motif containing protein [Ktedonobacterales bacterium]|nr:HNH endonuclease signature motif containing protein [Ktedonobacterales bacterium]